MVAREVNVEGVAAGEVMVGAVKQEKKTPRSVTKVTSSVFGAMGMGTMLTGVLARRRKRRHTMQGWSRQCCSRKLWSRDCSCMHHVKMCTQKLC